MHMRCCRAGAVLGGAWLCLQRCSPLLSLGKGMHQVLASPPLPSRPTAKQLWPKHEGQVSCPRPHHLKCPARHGVPHDSLLLWAWCRVRSPAVRQDSLNYDLESCGSPSTGVVGLNSLLRYGDVNCKIIES